MDNYCILVEDDKDCAELLEHELRKYFPVDVAHTGEDAISLLEEKRYAGMVLDLNLPGMSGLDILKRQEELFPDTKVIIFTGYSTESAAITAVKMGVVDYIVKPFPLKDLAALVKRHIGFAEIGQFYLDLNTETVFYCGKPIKAVNRAGGLFELFEVFARNSKSVLGYLELAQMIFKTYPRHTEKRPDLAAQLAAGTAVLKDVTDYLKPQLSRLRKELRLVAGYEVITIKANRGFGWSYRALNPEPDPN